MKKQPPSLAQFPEALLTGPRGSHLHTQMLRMGKVDDQGKSVPKVDVRLDLMGRAFDCLSGKYVKVTRVCLHTGAAIFSLGSPEGSYTTMTADGEFMAWSPPKGWFLQ